MSDTCKKCNSSVQVSKQDCFKCTACNGAFHPACLDDKSSDPNKKSSLRKNWKCEMCSHQDSEQDSVASILKAFRIETNAKLDQVQVDLASVKKDVSELKTQFKDIEKKCGKNTESIDKLVVENSRLCGEVKFLKLQVADLQQHTRKNNVIITGIPVTKGENVFFILQRIAALLNIRHDKYDVSAAHRPPNRNKNNPPPIVVNFVSRLTKSEWIHARKQRKGLSAVELHNQFPNRQIYINEHLAQHTSSIFNAARALLKTNKLASVWVREGRVLARKSATSPVFRIMNLDQLEEFKSASQTPEPTDNINDGEDKSGEDEDNQ
ncbi:uncharacterized protein LOC120349711 [Nilaparvata lugens]|uniref:uncharacterized protein LOC120349711 n=1 Tax=Nilaparvata lugens TaxID=108931 RepID=UPI00193CCEBC|nr:uncharacterized protein LOC120349711 [Nilaparvata lugens]